MCALAVFFRLLPPVRCHWASVNCTAKSDQFTALAPDWCESGRPVARLNASPRRVALTSSERKASASAFVSKGARHSLPSSSQRTVWVVLR